MAIKEARRLPNQKIYGVFKRTRGGSASNIVCEYWLAGRCTRNPCRFLHSESGASQQKQLVSAVFRSRQPKQSRIAAASCPNQRSKTWRRNPEDKPTSINDHENSLKTKSYISPSATAPPERKSTQNTQVKVCPHWVLGHCLKGEKCRGLHSWFCGNGFSMLAKLEGHSKAVTGIALPSGSDKLYSGSKDNSLRIWDCNSGQCTVVANLERVVGSLVSEGPWVFLGMPNSVKALNITTQTDLTLCGPAGEVYSMVAGDDMLFVGIQDGSILVYKYSPVTICPEPASSMKGHNRGVVSLVIGANRLYSGSLDKTIRVWNLETLQCIQTLDGHTDVVMSVLCWESFLLSGSLDGKIKVWAATEEGKLEVTYTHDVEYISNQYL